MDWRGAQMASCLPLALLLTGLLRMIVLMCSVPEYKSEYAAGLSKILQVAKQTGARVTILGTTPAHNTGTAADDVTVLALNKAAAALASETELPFVDLHTPLIKTCGPVPWLDNGTNACSLCAPKCKALSVHYDSAGYTAIANIIKNSL